MAQIEPVTVELQTSLPWWVWFLFASLLVIDLNQGWELAIKIAALFK